MFHVCYGFPLLLPAFVAVVDVVCTMFGVTLAIERNSAGPSDVRASCSTGCRRKSQVRTFPGKKYPIFPCRSKARRKKGRRMKPRRSCCVDARCQTKTENVFASISDRRRRDSNATFLRRGRKNCENTVARWFQCLIRKLRRQRVEPTSYQTVFLWYTLPL